MSAPCDDATEASLSDYAKYNGRLYSRPLNSDGTYRKGSFEEMKTICPPDTRLAVGSNEVDFKAILHFQSEREDNCFRVLSKT